MRIRATLNTLAAAAVLALALLTLPPDLAFAADNDPGPYAQLICEMRDYAWINGRCADRHCSNGGEPGETRNVNVGGPRSTLIMCDGLTGKWIVIATIQPGTSGGPGAPPPTAQR
jgi:hypothetical protein